MSDFISWIVEVMECLKEIFFFVCFVVCKKIENFVREVGIIEIMEMVYE